MFFPQSSGNMSFTTWQCFQLHSVSPVHESTVNAMKKKGNKNNLIHLFIPHVQQLRPSCLVPLPMKNKQVPNHSLRSHWNLFQSYIKWHSHKENKTLITTTLTESNPLQLFVKAQTQVTSSRQIWTHCTFSRGRMMTHMYPPPITCAVTSWKMRWIVKYTELFCKRVHAFLKCKP